MDHVQIAEPTTTTGWRADDLRRDDRWLYHLSEADIAELDTALRSVNEKGIDVPAITAADFPLPSLAAKLRAFLQEIESGLGVFLIRGLPMERYSKQDAGRIFWGIGAHLGRSVAQNAYGDVLGHVRDLGKDWNTDMSARGYQTTLHLPFHNDSCDVVSLLCLRTAKAGGASSVVSSVAIHDEIKRRAPDLLRVLYQPFYVDRRGEEAEGSDPYYLTPIFCQHAGRLFARFNRKYIESAQRFPQVPRLVPEQIAALDLFDALCQDESLRYDMELAPGDMQFVNNYTVLHSRTEYEDYPEPDRKRHLLRLWLFTPGLSDVPEAFKMRYQDMDAWQAHPRGPIYDLAEMMSISSH